MIEEKTILVGEYDGTKEGYERFKHERLGRHCVTAEGQRNDIIRSIQKMSASGDFQELEIIRRLLRKYTQQLHDPEQREEVWTMSDIIACMLKLNTKDLNMLRFFADRCATPPEVRRKMDQAQWRWANQHKEAKAV